MTLVVGTVYEFFSTSLLPIICLLFMIPLVLGVVPNLVAKMTRNLHRSEDAQAAYKMSVLTFTFGSFLKESSFIYGTSVYPTLYLPVGAVLQSQRLD